MTDTPTTPAESEWNESDLIMRFPPEVLKIVGKHSKFWNYDKSETLQKLDDWMQDTITKEKERAAVEARIDEIAYLARETGARKRTETYESWAWRVAYYLKGRLVTLEAKRKELS